MISKKVQTVPAPEVLAHMLTCDGLCLVHLWCWTKKVLSDNLGGDATVTRPHNSRTLFAYIQRVRDINTAAAILDEGVRRLSLGDLMKFRKEVYGDIAPA